MRRLPAALTLTAGLAGLLAVPALPTAAQAAPAQAVPLSAAAQALPVEPLDFATEAYGDPWDFANPQDANISLGVGTNERVRGPRVEGGVLAGDVLTGGEIDLVWSVDGALPWGRDGAAKPIDASRFTRLSMRMYSQTAGAGGLFWFSCRSRLPECWGGMPLTVRAGWNTYDVAVSKQFAATPQEWAGKIVALRLQPPGTDAGNPVQLDWVRLYQPLPGTAAGTTPPEGTDLRPRPVVLDPDAAGGQDYAATARGDAWDFSSPSDVAGLANTTSASFADGVLSATNAGPDLNDPQVQLPLAGPIDGSRYHRLSFRYRYDGPFDLRDAPGGGTMTRLIWSVDGSPAYQDLDDVVTFQGWNEVVVDLASDPPSRVVDPTTPVRIGWAGQRITSLRFDPNEDPGPKRWHLDDVRIAADDGGSDRFDVRFRDDAWEPGTTAEIWADSDAAGFDGTRLASGVAVQEGVNTFRWQNAGLPSGRYWIHVALSDGASTSRAYSSGPVQMVQGVPSVPRVRIARPEVKTDPAGRSAGGRRLPGRLLR